MDNRKPTVKRQRKQDMDIEERNNKTTTKNGDKEKNGLVVENKKWNKEK